MTVYLYNGNLCIWNAFHIFCYTEMEPGEHFEYTYEILNVRAH